MKRGSLKFLIFKKCLFFVFQNFQKCAKNIVIPCCFHQILVILLASLENNTKAIVSDQNIFLNSIYPCIGKKEKTCICYSSIDSICVKIYRRYNRRQKNDNGLSKLRFSVIAQTTATTDLIC